ncbi:MAG: hypothetical protein HFH10_05710 [Dorea sp.]|nr:hypothetical protein [Dorea sp.]
MFMKAKAGNYTQTKDAYEGNRESAVYNDSPIPSEKKPGRDTYGNSASDIIPDEVPGHSGPGGE